MAYDVVVSHRFEEDLDVIITYHVEVLHAPRAAKRLLDELDKTIGILACTPTVHAISRKPLLLELEYRECHVLGYVLLYRFDGDIVRVARMFHQSQDFEKLAFNE